MGPAAGCIETPSEVTAFILRFGKPGHAYPPARRAAMANRLLSPLAHTARPDPIRRGAAMGAARGDYRGASCRPGRPETLGPLTAPSFDLMSGLPHIDTKTAKTAFVVFGSCHAGSPPSLGFPPAPNASSMPPRAHALLSGIGGSSLGTYHSRIGPVSGGQVKTSRCCRFWPDVIVDLSRISLSQ